MEESLEIFHQQIRIGNVGTVKSMLDANPEFLDAIDADGSTPLLLACRNGYLEIVDFLLTRGSRGVTIPDNNQSLPSHWAAQGGHAEIITRLLQEIPVEDREGYLLQLNQQGRTAFWYAMSYNQPIAEWLLRLAPAALFIRSIAYPVSPIEYCLQRYRPEQAEKLFEIGLEIYGSDRMFREFDRSKSGDSLFITIIECRSISFLSKVLELYPTLLRQQPDQAMTTAIRTNRMETVELIWSHGERTVPGWNQFQFAVDYRVYTSFHHALENRNDIMIRWLHAKLMVIPNPRRRAIISQIVHATQFNSILHLAVQMLDLDMIRFILNWVKETCGESAMSFLISARNFFGNAPLHSCIDVMVNLPLENDFEGEAIHPQLSESGRWRTDIAEFLIWLGTDMSPNQNNRTCLDLTSQFPAKISDHSILFRALDPTMTYSPTDLDPETIQHLNTPLSVETIREIRDRVYFRHSLLDKLMFFLE